MEDPPGDRAEQKRLAIHGAPTDLRALRAWLEAPGERGQTAQLQIGLPGQAPEQALHLRLEPGSTSAGGIFLQLADLSEAVPSAAEILRGTGLAVLFLDSAIRLRCVTLAASALLGLRPEDLDRPLAPWQGPAADPWLVEDAALILAHGAVAARDITSSGRAFERRAVAHLSPDGEALGVVVTYTDVTECRALAQSLRATQERMRRASAANARFLSVIGHDLRQPLQTLILLQGLAMRAGGREAAQRLVAQMAPLAEAMTAILDRLRNLGRAQNELVAPHLSVFPVAELLDQMAVEFAPLAAGRGVELRLLPCGQAILSDQALLAQILRNLLGHALDQALGGRLLLGCRRRGERLLIEVHHTAPGALPGFPEDAAPLGGSAEAAPDPPLPEAAANPGLSLAQRLARQLDHPLGSRSSAGRGFCFSIEVGRAMAQAAPAILQPAPRTGVVFVVVGNAALRNLLVELLTMEGHRVLAAADAEAALALAPGIKRPPAIILTDHDLPGGMDGLQLGAALREIWGQRLPVLVLAEDDRPGMRDEIAAAGCLLLQKPVKPHSLASLIQGLLPEAERAPVPPPAALGPLPPPGSRLIYLVDDDPMLCAAMRGVLAEAGYAVRDYPSAEAFLAAYQRGGDACLLVDARLPGMSGLELLASLREAGDEIPSIMITGYSDLLTAVLAMRRGASDFVSKPVRVPVLLEVVDRAMAASRDSGKLVAAQADAAHRLAGLTHRQREILDRVLAGQPSKNIAADLGISRRTVEVHRAAIMRQLKVKSMPALVRLALSAAGGEGTQASG